jgi:ribonuclease HI
MVIRKLKDQQGGKFTLISVGGHVGITGNKNADTAAKEALNERMHSTEKYPPQNPTKWMIGNNKRNGTTR